MARDVTKLEKNASIGVLNLVIQTSHAQTILARRKSEFIVNVEIDSYKPSANQSQKEIL